MKAVRHLRSLAASAGLRVLAAGERPLPADGPKRLLVIGYAAIGDFIFFMPVLEGLRAAWPRTRITFLANEAPVTTELLPASGLVDEIWLHEWEGPRAGGQREINRRIHDARFDAAALTLSSPAHYFQWGLRGVPVRVGHLRPKGPGGWRYAWGRARRALVTGEPSRRALLTRPVPIPAASQPAVERNLRLLEALGVERPSSTRPRLPLSDAQRSWAARELTAVPSGKARVGLHLGPPRNQYHKIWDPERFGRLCARLAERWPVEFVVVGDAVEEEQLARARRHHPLPHSWIGKSSLLQTFALIERCALFLSNDTGPAKAAGALGVPTATLMGLSDPVEVGIPWDRDLHLNVRTGIPCSPCASLGMAREGQLNYLTCGHHDCMTRLQEDFVFDALAAKYAAVLDRSGARAQ